MGFSPFRIASLLTGLTVAGEALALLIGMHILSASDNPWISVKNDLFLALDIIAGLGLLYLVLARQTPPYPFYFLVILALLTHSYRVWEYWARASSPFCANAPLFVVNNLKLAGLLAVAILGVQLV